MPDSFKKSLNVFLIKNILSGILAKEDHKSLNDRQSSSKHDDFVNFTNATKVDMDKRLVGTKVKVINEISPTNLSMNCKHFFINNNWSNSTSHESVLNDTFYDLHQTEDEWNDFLDEQKELPLEIMFTKNKSFLENKIDEKEINVESQSMVNRVKNYSFATKCHTRRPMLRYDYSCKTRNASFKHVESLTPVKEKKWFEDYKMELQFLQENFSEVLPEILYDVVRKRVTDPVYYIAHCLMKYKVDKSTDG